MFKIAGGIVLGFLGIIMVCYVLRDVFIFVHGA